MAALNAGLLAYQTGSSFLAQRGQANAAIQQGNYAQQAYNTNAATEEAQAADAVQRGAIDAGSYRAGTRQAIGAERAAAGAGGVTANSGSVLDTQADTARTGALDIANIQNNALREAWGYKVAANNDRQQGVFAQRAGRNTAAQLRAGAFGTLLTGAAQAYGQYKFAQDNRTPGLSIPKTARPYNLAGK